MPSTDLLLGHVADHASGPVVHSKGIQKHESKSKGPPRTMRSLQPVISSSDQINASHQPTVNPHGPAAQTLPGPQPKPFATCQLQETTGGTAFRHKSSKPAWTAEVQAPAVKCSLDLSNLAHVATTASPVQAFSPAHGSHMTSSISRIRCSPTPADVPEGLDSKSLGMTPCTPYEQLKQQLFFSKQPNPHQLPLLQTNDTQQSGTCREGHETHGSGQGYHPHQMSSGIPLIPECHSWQPSKRRRTDPATRTAYQADDHLQQASAVGDNWYPEGQDSGPLTSQPNQSSLTHPGSTYFQDLLLCSSPPGLGVHGQQPHIDKMHQQHLKCHQGCREQSCPPADRLTTQQPASRSLLGVRLHSEACPPSQHPHIARSHIEAIHQSVVEGPTSIVATHKPDRDHQTGGAPGQIQHQLMHTGLSPEDKLKFSSLSLSLASPSASAMGSFAPNTQADFTGSSLPQSPSPSMLAALEVANAD